MCVFFQYILLCSFSRHSLYKVTNAKNIAACTCNDGFWNGGRDECLPCPDYAVCTQGKKPVTEIGYWRVPWRTENINPDDKNVTRLSCLSRCACLGAPSSIATTENCPVEEETEMKNQSTDVEERCRTFHTGPLCAACEKGSYKEAATFRCLKCFDTQELSILFICLVVFATLLVIVGMTFATVADGGQAAAVDVIILKIAVNSGIISAGASAFPLAWPKSVVTMFQMYAVASASAIGDSLSADCVLRTSDMRPTQAWSLTMVIIPPFVVFLWCVVFGLASVCSKVHYLKVHFPVACIVTLLFAHPVVTKSAVKLVACRTVAGKRYLDADFNVSCDSEEYLLWVSAVAVPLFVLYTFGIPLTYALAMYRHVRKGTLHARRDIYGFFFSGKGK